MYYKDTKMLLHTEFKYNKSLIDLFEHWVDGSFPDDNYRFDKIYKDDGTFTYEFEDTDYQFDIWINCIYYMTHPNYKSIVDTITLEYIFDK